jgi:integral membrane sensor domain MASE1
MYSKLPRRSLVLAAIFAIYFALGQAGLAAGGFAGGTVAVWPPSGFAIAALIVAGRRSWPAVFAGALAALLIPTGHVVASTIAAAGYTVEAIVGAMLVDRFARGAQAFQSAGTIFRFVGIAAVAGTLSATFGALSTTWLAPSPRAGWRASRASWSSARSRWSG